VVSGEGVWRLTSGTFVLGAGNPNYELRRGPVELPLRVVQWVARQYREASTDQAPNYEQIALVLQQVSGALSGEYESPAVLPFAVQLGDALAVPAHEIGRYATRQSTTSVTASFACYTAAGSTTTLILLGITEACRQIDRVDLATLNHDLLLDRALRSRDVPYADGFENTSRRCRIVD